MAEKPENEQAITKDMLIGDLVARHPECVEVLLDEGVHCVGCGAAHFETIEQGLAGHGRTPEEIERIIEALNEAAQSADPNTITITERAAHKLREFVESKGKQGSGLRISVAEGGCAGLTYNFDLEDQRNDGDTVIEVAEVKFYIDAQSMAKLRGARVDYVETLEQSGFRITNPNAQASCGCGNSFR